MSATWWHTEEFLQVERLRIRAETLREVAERGFLRIMQTRGSPETRRLVRIEEMTLHAMAEEAATAYAEALEQYAHGQRGDAA